VTNLWKLYFFIFTAFTRQQFRVDLDSSYSLFQMSMLKACVEPCFWNQLLYCVQLFSLSNISPASPSSLSLSFSLRLGKSHNEMEHCLMCSLLTIFN
jgi:hypothetical protein